MSAGVYPCTGARCHGWQCGREMAGTGREQPASLAGNLGIPLSCDAISADRSEFLARAVTLVAGMAIPEQVRSAVLARVVADMGGHTTRLQEG